MDASDAVGAAYPSISNNNATIIQICIANLMNVDRVFTSTYLTDGILIGIITDSILEIVSSQNILAEESYNRFPLLHKIRLILHEISCVSLHMMAICKNNVVFLKIR